MTVLPVQTGADNPILRRKAAKVPKVTKAIQQLIKDMRATVRDENGAGLAAPQVGQSLSLCLAQVDGKMTVLINPKILNRGPETDRMDEGCLSLPGLTVEVERSTDITVRYLDEQGKETERRFQDFDARVVQHEVDHLNGRLIADYLQASASTTGEGIAL
ncbi:MAG: peptide deformylase [Candidatus Peribacteraceae bacterium]|nr:peptide deformylase [Candidatus Peribacteraceae bacterium]